MVVDRILIGMLNNIYRDHHVHITEVVVPFGSVDKSINAIVKMIPHHI